MSSGMPELGSKISLISKADIRYEGRLFTVDPQECTIALASVRSFGTEDRETQYPVAPQSQVYDYILFRGSDIKDIRVLNNVPSLPNDPAIMQMSVPPTLGGGNQPPQFGASVPQFQHPVVGQNQFQQYHPMAGFPGGMQAQLNKTSELSPSVDLALGAHAVPIGSGMMHHANQVKDQGSMLDLIGGGQNQNASRSGTPGLGGLRKSPTADQGTQVGAAGGSQQRERRGSGPQHKQQQPPPQQQQQQRQRNHSGNRNNRQRYPSGGNAGPMAPQHSQAAGPPHHQHNQHNQHNQHQNQHGHNLHGQHGPHGPLNQMGQQMHPGAMGGYGRGGGGGWRGRARGRGRGFALRPGQKSLKFDNDYDFEQANTEFEELRSQLTKVKISDEPAKDGDPGSVEVDKKDDSGNETGAGEPEVEEEGQAYDKAKSFFDNISCEAVERSKGRSQRTDWRTERKLNSETFGVASARRGAWRGRGGWRQYPHHMQQMNSFSWRGGRGAGYAGGAGAGPRARGGPGQQQQQQHQPQQHQQQQSAPVTAK